MFSMFKVKFINIGTGLQYKIDICIRIYFGISSYENKSYRSLIFVIIISKVMLTFKYQN